MRAAQVHIPHMKYIVSNVSSNHKTAGGVAIGIPPGWKCENLESGVKEEISIKVEDDRLNKFILSTHYNRPRANVQDHYLDHLKEISEN